MEPTMEYAQRVMVREQHVVDMVQFQVVPITNMIQDHEIEIDDRYNVKK